MRVLTVATASYLNQVDVLFQRIRLVHPELMPTVLVADCSPSAIGPVRRAFGVGVDVLCCADLGLEALKNMRTYYTALEFCSSLKVLASAHILRSEPECLFLDPDIIVYASLREAIFDQPGEVVVTNHAMAPYPRDGALPDDIEPCLAGHINGGVFFTRREQSGTPAIDWLTEKTRYEWFVAPSLGMYADQQWLSALPYFFRDRTTIVSDRGVNVAYWNLHERSLRRSSPLAPVTLADGSLLRLMHFSGFPSPSTGRLTKHSNRVFDKETEIILDHIVADYGAALSQSHARLSHLKGDLGFSKKPLSERMRVAERLWGAKHPVRQGISLAVRLKKAAHAIREVIIS